MSSVLEMALEALEWADNFHNEGEPVQVRVAEAIAALKGAITQQEKDSRADYCGSCGQWTGGPVICCHESESNPKPLITKAEAKALREAIKNQGEPVARVVIKTGDISFYLAEWLREPNDGDLLYTSTLTIPEGWQLVPVAPTPKMIHEGQMSRLCPVTGSESAAQAQTINQTCLTRSG